MKYYPMGYVAMLKALEKQGLLPAFKNKAEGLSIVARARRWDARRARQLLARPARASTAPETKAKAPTSPANAPNPAKTLLDLLRAFKSLYAKVHERYKKDKRFLALNRAKKYKTEARDLLLLRAMARKFSPALVETAIESFMEYSLQKDRPITIQRFEIWSRTKWKNRTK